MDSYQVQVLTDFEFSQEEGHSTSQVLFVRAQIHFVSCSSRTWRISYLQCTLLGPLLSFSLLLGSGRRVESGLLFKGRTQDDYQCR